MRLSKYIFVERKGNEKWVVRTKASDSEEEFAIPRLQPIPQKTKQSFKREHLKEIHFLK